MHRLWTASLLVALTGCSSAAPYVSIVGSLQPGSVMNVHVAQASFNAFGPANGQPRDRYLVEATALDKNPPAAPKLRPILRGVEINAPDPLQGLLVRVPDGVDLNVDSQGGDVLVSDIPGNAFVKAKHGNVQIYVTGYAQASLQRGRMSVTIGALQWPGTLHFSDAQGDVEVFVSESASFHVHLFTANGNIVTDYDMHGTQTGRSESADLDVNGGGSQRIDVEAGSGTIRFLKLHHEG